jgi:hypothetical protein
MRAVMAERADNLHTVFMSGQPLGVECVCGRRQLLTHAQLGGCRGNMKELRQLKKQLKCRACGQRPKDLRTFYTAEQVQAFEMEHDRPGPRF